MSHVNETVIPDNPYKGLTLLEVKRIQYPIWGHQIVGGFLLLVLIGGFMENLLIMFIFWKNKELLSPTNIFILAVAIGDFGMACLGVPLPIIGALNGKWFMGEFLCKWQAFVVYFVGLSQMYLLMAVSVDRYVVITKPHLALRITKKVAIACMASCFGLAFFLALMPIIGWSSYGLEASGVFCGLRWEDHSARNTSYIAMIIFFCYFGPIGVMIFSYYHLFMAVKMRNRNTVLDVNSRVARRNIKIEIRLLKSCVVMCLVYWAVWTPYAIVSLIQVCGYSDSIPLVLTEIPGATAKSQIVWNPIIYVATNKQFRDAFYATLPCKRLRENVQRPPEERGKTHDRPDEDHETTNV
ncbi:visual pigment-like receptor peropsin [Mya arenaria]|uniref:visual pigment-like receptor peropsin n=1 Tax=Mya arenaria TaxID=6604 RepID=UPI0022E79586|nr:visual pigment-like receptor peropsin [Mya arenaria]